MKPLQTKIVAPSSALGDPTRLQQGIELLRSWGLNVSAAPDPSRHWGYYAGSDAERLADFNGEAELWACARGGWGAARLLEQGWQPPNGWLLGFSDVTSLLWAHQAAGKDGAIHGPMVTTLASEPEWSQARLHALLAGQALPPLQGEGWRSGIAEGPLLVGNLTVATHLLGTPHCPALTGRVLLLEDIGEAPYRIDRLLTHWRLSGALQQLAGLGFGRFEGCEAPSDDTRPGFELEQVLRERSCDLGIPVVGALPFGHGQPNAAFPLGRTVRLDGSSGSLSVL